jgi:hypothetical protein
MNILQEKSTVIVVFAGLMFFHYNEPLQYFKVGILKGAPHHEFQIYNPNAQKVLTKVTAEKAARRQQSPDYPDEMVLEVVNHRSGTRTTEATFFQEGLDFLRTDSPHNPEDYRYIISFDELYRTEGHSIRDGSLGPNIYIRAGQLYTLCLTDFLRSRKGLSTKDFGPVADLMGLRVELQRDQSLVLSGTDLEVKYQPGEQYVVIANIPSTKHRCPNADHCKNFDTHFRYYYGAVPKLFYERYDFGHKNPEPKGCLGLPKEIADYLYKVQIATPPPYFCGIGSTSKEWSLSAQPSTTSKKRSPSKKH